MAMAEQTWTITNHGQKADRLQLQQDPVLQINPPKIGHAPIINMISESYCTVSVKPYWELTHQVNPNIHHTPQQFALAATCKKCRPHSTYPVLDICCTFTYYALLILLYVGVFLFFLIGTTNILLRKLFPQFLFTIFCIWVLVQISDVSQERGSYCCIVDQIQTCMFRPSISPLKMVEYPAAARRRAQEPTYAKYRTIYVKQPFKHGQIGDYLVERVQNVLPPPPYQTPHAKSYMIFHLGGGATHCSGRVWY